MAMLTQMPAEIVFKILEYKDVTIKDVVNFSSASKQFRQLIINDKNLWRKKFFQRWPSVKKYYEENDKKFCEADITDVQNGMKCAKELWAYISYMSEKHYYDVNNHKYVDEFSSLFSQHKDCSNAQSIHCAILKDEIIKIIYTQSPWECDLTHRYYSIKLFRCWLKQNFDTNWKKFINKPHQQQILENVLAITLQWFQPENYISLSHVDKLIENIMQNVLKLLKEKNPTHKIFSISSEQFSFWKHNNIHESYWGETSARQIKCTLDDIILNFDCYNIDYPWKMDQVRICAFIQSCCKMDYPWKMDQIEKYNFRKLHNKKLLWSVVYICVARRMGIHIELEIINSGDIYLSKTCLTWKPRGCREYTEYFNIKKYDEFNQQISVIIIYKSPQDVPDRMKLSIKQILYELEKVFQNYMPIDFPITLPSEIDINSDMYTAHFNKKCYERRSDKIKFAIGMVVNFRNNKIGSSYVGVIIGWHNKYQIEWFSFRPYELGFRFNIGNLVQPFYIILMDYDNICYVPQSFITSICSKSHWIYHTEIGRYFCKIADTHYVPNEMLAKHYPKDAAVIRETFNNSNNL